MFETEVARRTFLKASIATGAAFLAISQLGTTGEGLLREAKSSEAVTEDLGQ